MPRAVKLEVQTKLTVDGIVGFIRRPVVPHGTGAKVTCPKEFLGKTVYLVITDEESFRINDGKLMGGDGSLLAGGDAEEMDRTAIADQDGEFIRAVATGYAPATSVHNVMPAMRVLQKVEEQRGEFSRQSQTDSQVDEIGSAARL